MKLRIMSISLRILPAYVALKISCMILFGALFMVLENKYDGHSFNGIPFV